MEYLDGIFRTEYFHGIFVIHIYIYVCQPKCTIFLLGESV